MATVRHHRRIPHPARDVWRVVGDAGSIQRWFPGIVDSIVGEDDDGPFRVVQTASGLSLKERIVTNDATLRRFQYRIDLPAFREHLGTVDVIDLEDDSSLVVYGTDAEPPVMALVIGGAASDALERLEGVLDGEVS